MPEEENFPVFRRALLVTVTAPASDDQCALVAISKKHAEQPCVKLRLAIESARTWYKSHLLPAQLLHFTGHYAASKYEAGPRSDSPDPEGRA